MLRRIFAKTLLNKFACYTISALKNMYKLPNKYLNFSFHML